MRVTIIGSGRLGTAMGLALQAIGHSVGLFVAKHVASSRQAAALINRSAAAISQKDLNHLQPQAKKLLLTSELILISTPDDAIQGVTRQLARMLSAGSRPTGKRIALHTSGALSSEMLKPLRAVGFRVGSLHPLVSVTEGETNADVFRNAFFCIEGDSAATRLARSIVKDLGGESITIEAESKPLYHAAAVLTAGHTTALFDVAIEMLGRCGLSPERAQEVLLPLLESTVANLRTKTPKGALTGTFARGDLVTVRKHLDSIKSENLRDALAIYGLLGQRSLRLSNIQNASRSEIAELLSRG